jgi:hypothetical protein
MTMHQMEALYYQFFYRTFLNTYLKCMFFYLFEAYIFYLLEVYVFFLHIFNT